jgi:hypothetical protein
LLPPDIEDEPNDPTPEAGDTVIELRNGVPYIYTQGEEEEDD